MNKLKNKKIVFSILIVIIIFGPFIWKYFTDDFFSAQLKDKNADKSFELLNESYYSFNSDKGKKNLEKAMGTTELIGPDYILGDTGVYGELFNELSLKDYKMDATEQNLKLLDYYNKERILLLEQYSKVLKENTNIREVKTYYDDKYLYKDVKMKSFNEMGFREAWYDLTSRIMMEAMNKEYNGDRTSFTNLYEGEIFTMRQSQNKAFELMLQNVEKFEYKDEEFDFTLRYENKNGKWVLYNGANYSDACSGYYLKVNNDEDIKRMHDNRLKVSKDIYNKHIKGKSKEEILKTTIKKEDVEKIKINISEY